MAKSAATGQSAEERVWKRCIERSQKGGITETAAPRHMRHAGAYLQAFPGTRLGERTRGDVAGYVEHAGELDRMAGWRLVQVVGAIQNLLATARA